MPTVADRPEAQTAIQTNLAAIFISLELSRSIWLITSLSPGGGEKMSKHSVPAGDIAALLARFSELKQKALARTGKSFPIVTIQEAGLDGFWLHRVLQSEGIESHVVDPASDCDVAPTAARQDRQDRRRGAASRATGVQARRASGVRHGQGADARGRRPSPPLPRAQSADRRAGQACQSRQGTAVLPGVSGYEPLRRDRRQRLDELTTGDGRPLPTHLKTQISRELDRLELLLDQIKAAEAERDALLAAQQPATPAPAGGCCST